MNKWKKYIKIIGNILSIIAIIYVIHRFLEIGVDLKQIINRNSIALCIILLFIQISVIMTSCFPWGKLVEIVSDRRIPFVDSMLVYMKANLFKYIPGNVFQYVARNELAIESNVEHLDVAIATVLDTAFSLLFALVLSIICLGDVAIDYLLLYKNRIGVMLLVAFLILIVIVCVIYFFFKARGRAYFQKYKKCLQKKNIKKILQILLYYLYNNLVNFIIFAVIIVGVLGCSIENENWINLMGAFIFALIAGMITPGASGGIGIRESVMMLITKNRYDIEMIISAMVILRLISIMADVGAFAIRGVWILIRERVSDKER